jgi:hypothetical protein
MRVKFRLGELKKSSLASLTSVFSPLLYSDLEFGTKISELLPTITSVWKNLSTLLYTRKEYNAKVLSGKTYPHSCTQGKNIRKEYNAKGFGKITWHAALSCRCCICCLFPTCRSLAYDMHAPRKTPGFE